MTTTLPTDVISAPRRPKVYLPRGLPGSGKSTLYTRMRADNPRLARVSRDDARATLFNEHGRLDHTREEIITKAERAQAKALLEAGWDVFVDAMNLRAYWARGWANFAALNGADLEVINLETTVDDCVARDRERAAAGGRAVGEDAIRALGRKFPRNRWPEITASPDLFFYPDPYVPDETLPPAWIFDIDGTLSRMVTRGPHEYERADEDEPNVHVVEVAQKLAPHAAILQLTGRPEWVRTTTTNWLQRVGAPSTEMHMRADGDKRPDYLVKSELFGKVRDRYRILGVFDDRLQVCRLWHRLGVPLLRAGAPDHDDF
ncbi:AAA family ATPase [Nocardia sp. NPDC056611]|uniref:phosphatase domain-containing protein n=1 Tax=Nocardia sp. NPDC056611 TaxID=3345877 RepID=UPI00366FDE46